MMEYHYRVQGRYVMSSDSELDAMEIASPSPANQRKLAGSCHKAHFRIPV